MRRFFLVFLAFAFLVLPATTYAADTKVQCVCKEVSVKDNLKAHEHVFSAQVEKVLVSSNDRHVAKVKILDAYKGYQNAEVDVYTPNSPEKCGFTFQKGKQYLIYANIDKEGKFYTEVCDNNKLLSEAKSDFDSLPVPQSKNKNVQRPTKDVREIVGKDSSPIIFSLLLMGTLLLLGVGVNSAGKK